MVTLAELILEGSKHECERGAELMTDVAEEGGLDDIELSQFSVRVAQLMKRPAPAHHFA